MFAPVDTASTARPINFRVVLPAAWNRRGAQVGGGGINGIIPNLTGAEFVAHNFRNGYECAVDSFGTLFMSDNDDDDGNQYCRFMYASARAVAAMSAGSSEALYLGSKLTTRPI